MKTTRAWHLTSRPTGLPRMDNFALGEVPLPELEEGWVRVEN
jgi:NADPH-dependent curcumin reductase CurA